MVLQETILLRGTVAYNIAYGREGATLEEVVRAAKLANAHDFVMAMPDGYDTVLGERAATLSGGQRQRLAIARAFIRDTPILIMDEPTTGLDAESAALVAEALQTLARNRSTRHRVARPEPDPHGGPRPGDLRRPDPRGGQPGRPAGQRRALRPAVRAAVRRGGGRDGAPYRPRPAEPSGRGAARRPEKELELAWRPSWRPRAFDTVLTQAMPLPASREEFQALTGWIPARPPRRRRPRTSSTRSARRPSPGRCRAWPRRDARPAMAPRLQRMLADDWELLACSPGKAFVEPETGATLQYRLELRRRGAGETVEHLVAGRLFPTERPPRRGCRASTRWPTRLDGRDDLRAFARPTLLVRELRLVLHAFPLDPALPGLVPATDPAELVETLGPLLDELGPRTAPPGLPRRGRALRAAAAASCGTSWPGGSSPAAAA